jgi:hypothetical protein
MVGARMTVLATPTIGPVYGVSEGGTHFAAAAVGSFDTICWATPDTRSKSTQFRVWGGHPAIATEPKNQVAVMLATNRRAHIFFPRARTLALSMAQKTRGGESLVLLRVGL